MILNKFIITSLLLFLSCFSLIAQDKDKKKKPITKDIVIDSITKVSNPINPLSPAKAAFYSAILPGLGQAYNKKYWKIPVVYAAIGTGVYVYVTNNKEYNRYRDAFKSRLAGNTNDEFFFDSQGNQLEEPRISIEGLERAQRLFRKNQEIALLVTIGLYALNIIDANVDAHLLQYNIDENLSLAPKYQFNDIDASSNIGLTLNFKF